MVKSSGRNICNNISNNNCNGNNAVMETNRFLIHQAESFVYKYNLEISRCHWIDFDNAHEVRKCIDAI